MAWLVTAPPRPPAVLSLGFWSFAAAQSPRAKAKPRQKNVENL